MGFSATIIFDTIRGLWPETKHVKKRAPPLLLYAAGIVIIRLTSTVRRRHLLSCAAQVVHNGATSLLQGFWRITDHNLKLKVLNVVIRLDLCAAAIGKTGSRVEDVAAERTGQCDDYSTFLAGDLQGLPG